MDYMNQLLGALAGAGAFSPGFAAQQQAQAQSALGQLFSQHPMAGQMFQQRTLSPLERCQQEAAYHQAMRSVSPPRKRVESRTLTPDEVARKQISGAVQAVKDAQNEGF
jgi:hypothetical protein